MRELSARIPGLSVEGIGGPLMLEEGLSPLFPLESLQVHGLVEVVRHLPRLYRILWALEARMDAAPPDAVLLIDYPGFN
ncbi:MAG: lipid-A-disaccharide synthase, partial [bacterium]